MRSTTVPALALIALVLVALLGCVEERTTRVSTIFNQPAANLPRSGFPITPTPDDAATPGPTAPRDPGALAASGASAALGSSGSSGTTGRARTPVESDARAALRNAPPAPLASSRVVFGVQTLGEVDYDGTTLPLIDDHPAGGKFLAVQTGVVAPWGALLGEPGATSPGTRVVVYDLNAKPLRPVVWPEAGDERSIPVGALLGRSGDAEGFLIEWPRPDGSRWIGKAAWTTGRVTWLVRDAATNAHALLLRNGGLIFSRRLAAPRVDPAANGAAAARAQTLAPASLVYRSPDGGLRTLLDASESNEPVSPAAPASTPGRRERVEWAFPTLSPDQLALGVWRVRSTLSRDDLGSGAPGAPGAPGAATPAQAVVAAELLGFALTPAGEVVGSTDREPIVRLSGPSAAQGAFQAVIAMEGSPSASAGGPGIDQDAILALDPATGRLVSWSPRRGTRLIADAAGPGARVAGPTAGLVGYAIAMPEGLVFRPATGESSAQGLAPSTKLIDGATMPRQTGRADGSVLVIRPAPAAGRSAGINAEDGPTRGQPPGASPAAVGGPRLRIVLLGLAEP
jgi:hypothetical protein